MGEAKRYRCSGETLLRCSFPYQIDYYCFRSLCNFTVVESIGDNNVCHPHSHPQVISLTNKETTEDTDTVCAVQVEENR
jgi:hypothetical protein